MKKYHVAAADGKSYYGCGYESRSEATELLRISQCHDPQAHIVEEECYSTNADHIRAMTDEELAGHLAKMLADYTTGLYDGNYVPSDEVVREMALELLRQLQQPYESNGKETQVWQKQS